MEVGRRYAASTKHNKPLAPHEENCSRRALGSSGEFESADVLQNCPELQRRQSHGSHVLCIRNNWRRVVLLDVIKVDHRWLAWNLRR